MHRFVGLLLLLGTTASSFAEAPVATSTASDPAWVARYRDGVLSSAQLDAFRRFRPRIESARAIEELVLLRTLERRFRELGLDTDPSARARLRLQYVRFAEQALQRALRDDIRVTDAEVERAFRSDPEQFDQPKRYKLQNLLLRVAPDADTDVRTAKRRQLEALRSRLTGGADFAELARAHSDSQTRRRGGSMGAVDPAKLRPEIAHAVRALGDGDLSPVLETADGFVLLRCEAVVEAKVVGADEARRRIRAALERNQLADLRASVVEQVERKLASASISLPADRTRSLATYTLRGTRFTLGQADFEAFLRHRRIEAPEKLTADETETLLRERIQLDGLADEAERRGLLADPEVATQLDWRRRALRASLALDAQATTRITPITEAALRARYARWQARLRTVERVKLRALRTRIEAQAARARYERFRTIGKHLAEGKTTFEDAARTLGEDTEVVDYGWLGPRQVFDLGLNVELAIGNLTPGQSSGVVQEGRWLYMLSLDAREPARPLTFEEARARLESHLYGEHLDRARSALRHEIIQHQAIQPSP